LPAWPKYKRFAAMYGKLAHGSGFLGEC
jgi:hypothetical protein